ncbi:MAG TPA: hypothetical protein VJ464_06495 [Blastocatellia bacterium]|nr:hypothetical protein [Blastocatellia bacterium]
MPYIVETAQFKAEGAVVDWPLQAKRLGFSYAGNTPRLLHLRWMIHPELGMPTEPFIVWRRSKNNPGPVIKDLNFTVTPEAYLFGSKRVDWTDGLMMRVVVDIQANVAGLMTAYAGSATFGSMTQFINVPAGNSTLTIEAPEIDGLILQDGMNVTKVKGIPADWLVQAAGWAKLEIVGLPVVKAEWVGVGKHASDQGMVGALTDPGSAAMQRLARGGPQVGWQPKLPTGETVPAWVAPNYALLIDEVRKDVLTRLKPVMLSAPDQQITKKVSEQAVLENSNKQQMPHQNNQMSVAPLALMLLAAGTDPWYSLALGFGTAYDARTTGITGAGSEALMYDYMITARWEKGLNGSSASPFEMAALVPAPTQAVACPTPANLSAALMGYQRPHAVDQDWRCSVMTNWDRFVDNEIFRPRTYAFVRAGLSPVEPIKALMQPRTSGGLRHLVINGVQSDPLPGDWWQLGAVERELPIPSAATKRTNRYGICQQDIYGQWSPWGATDLTVDEPAVDDVRIVSAHLRPSLPANANSAVCPTTLEIEFLWDWRVRGPGRIRFVGRLYPAANHGDPPPSLVRPNVLQRDLNGNGSMLVIHFTNDTPDPLANVTFTPLSADGQQSFTSFGQATQGNRARRYRVTVSDFSLNFANTAHIGLALWAQGQERIPPQRDGDWSNRWDQDLGQKVENPTVISTSDPRPPKVEPDIVQLASLPDSAGECHARLTWNPGNPSTNAAGYFIYETTESKILRLFNQGDPPQDQSLSLRLTEIKNLFKANPASCRSVFTKRNSEPLKATSADVTLPKGTTSIHLYVVLGMNAGQVESDWPSGNNADDHLQAFAAPRIQKPSPPTIEARALLDENVSPPVYRAQLRIGSRTGPRVKRVELFRVRVDDAAKELETMGPPVAVITSGGPNWSVSTNPGSSDIATISGHDTPPGSWKRVWYRATAWSERDQLRGYLAGRSPASSAVSIVVPPATPPDLSAVKVSWPNNGDIADALLEWTSSAPLHKTVLGPHILTARAKVAGAPWGSAPLIDLRSELDALPGTKPLKGSGVWLVTPVGPGRQYAAYIHRASANDAVGVAIRLTDPLGRVSEQVVQIPSGSLLPAPELHRLAYRASPMPPGINFAFGSSAPLNVMPPYMVRVRTSAPHQHNFNAELKGALAAIPVTAQWPPPGNAPLTWRRMPGNGPNYEYQVFCRVPVGTFQVWLTSFDGRVAEQTLKVS